MPRGVESSPKRQRTECHKGESETDCGCAIDPVKLSATLGTVSSIQDKLAQLDREIVTRQGEIECSFSSQKAELYRERDALLSEDFWSSILSLHPVYVRSVIPHELDLVRKYLRKIQVNDHLDAQGSHEIIFEFDEAAPFKPNVLRKKILFNSDLEIDADKAELTSSITFSDPKTDPRELIRKMYEDESDDCESSLFDWFSKLDLEHPCMSQFGEIIRRDIYPNPESMLFNASDSELSDENE